MIVRTSRVAARSTFRAGFTLMELLVVVALLVVLAGTGGVIYMNYLESAKEDVARAQVQTLTQAAQMYAIAHGGTFAPDLNSLTQPTADGKAASLEVSALIDPWQRPYQYQYPGQHHPGQNKPDVWSTGPDGNTQIGNWAAGR